MKKIKLEAKYKNLMELWIEDLRENADLQGEEFLYNSVTGSYCCLGRLCLVAHHEPEYFAGESCIPISYSRIPGAFKGNSELFDVLTALNDGAFSTKARSLIKQTWEIDDELGQSFTFPEIADFLEERIEYYEKGQDQKED